MYMYNRVTVVDQCSAERLAAQSGFKLVLLVSEQDVRDPRDLECTLESLLPFSGYWKQFKHEIQSKVDLCKEN